MKELSREEKAKAYDEAKLRMSKAYNENRCTIGFMNEIFPELKESEDEKIRKSLIYYFEDFHLDTFACLDPKKILAWLEKQGEQKSIDINISEFDTRLNKLLIQFESLPKEELTNSLSFYLNVIQNDGTYKEHKPIELSEEDEECFNVVDSLIWYHLVGSETDKTYYSNWLKFLKDRVQSKREWSEEDERNASYICAALDCYYRLREDRNNTNGQEYLDKARNWLYTKLKSLRPQLTWKLSNEQMLAINTAINVLGKCTLSGKQLIELREQLKKLMEE